MAVDLRLPNITGTTEKEQIAQLQSYLYQLVEQLMWVLSGDANDTSFKEEPVAIDTSATSVIAKESFEEMKPLIIKDAEIIEAYAGEIDRRLRLTGYYAEQEDLEKAQQSISALNAYHTVHPYDGLDFDTLMETTCSYAGDDEPKSAGCSHYPTNKPGILEVTALTNSAYHTYRTIYGDVYTRSYSATNGWSDWAMHSIFTADNI